MPKRALSVDEWLESLLPKAKRIVKEGLDGRMKTPQRFTIAKWIIELHRRKNGDMPKADAYGEHLKEIMGR